jgi:endonuclease/exonuclease/phosphatase (EEP) superfamily protein YafD
MNMIEPLVTESDSRRPAALAAADEPVYGGIADAHNQNMELPADSKSSRRGRMSVIRFVIGAMATLVLAGLIATELFAWLLLQTLDERDRWYVRFVAISFFVRVFQLHIGVGAILLSMLLGVVRWRRSAVLSLVTALTLLTPFVRDFAPKNPPAAASRTLRLMSINLYFQNRDEAAILRSIADADPDVIVFVEVTPWSLENVIQKHLLERYQYVHQPPVDTVGMMLTRLPHRIGKPAENAGGSFRRQPVVFDLGGKEIAVYAVHLVSPGHLWLVERNREQVMLLSEIAKAEKREMVIAGDCNFSQLTPNAAALHRAGMRTSHELIGFGLGNTWGPKWWPALNWLPGVRIDHVWLSPGLTVTSSKVGLDTGSDHRPVIANIAIAANPRK